jgi:DNA-binding transcriptional ArsR family regulator
MCSLASSLPGGTVASPSAARRHRGTLPARPGNRDSHLKGVHRARWKTTTDEAALFDSLIHHRIRLGIVSALAGAESLSFNELKALLKTTDGNLSVHARKLEEARYVDCRKTFAERRPLTVYRLAGEGRKALQRYLDHMEALIAVTRNTLER